MASLAKTLTYEQALTRITELEAELERARKLNRQLFTFSHLSESVSANLNIEQVLDIILAEIAKIVPFDSATLMLVEHNQLRAIAARGFARRPMALNVYPRNSKNSAWRVVEQKAPLVISDVQATEDWESRNGMERIRAWLGIPIIAKDEVFGVLTLDSYQPGTYTQKDAELIFTLGYQVAIAVENASLFERLKTQRDQMLKLQELNQTIAPVLVLDKLLPLIVRQIPQMLGSTRCALWLFDDAGETATLKAWYNLETSGRQINTTFEVAYYPIMQQMLTLNWPLLINKLAAFLQEVAWPDKSESLVIPLCYKEKNIGFIVTDNTEKREAFLQDRLTLAMNAANQVVLSIRGVQLFAENARLYHKATQRLSDLTVLYDAGQAFISTLDLDKILGIVMERTCAALSAEYGYALLTNDAQTEITFVATVGPNAQILKGHTIPAVGSVMGTVVRQGKALLINDTAALPEFLGEIDDYVNAVTKSLMVAPLKTKRGVLGALIVTNKQSGEFNKNNLNLLTSLSQLASGAIENARLFRQVQKYSQDLEEAVSARTVHLTAVNETGRAISSIVPMDELFARVTRFISELFNQARVSVGLRTGNYITFQKIYDGEFEPGTVPANHRLKISKYHILGQVILTGGADLIETISTAQLYKLKDESERPSTALVVPLTIGGKTIGIIVVQSRSWLASQQQDLGTLQSLAYQVAVAMENSRLLQKSREMATIRERTRLARDMHDGIAQNLAYLLLQVDRCLVMAEVKNPKLEDELENISQVISQNIEELRRHIFDLRPVGLEGHSIYKVLKQMTGDFGDKLGLETSCEIIGDEIELPFDVEASLYRIFQEALSNIRRYAQCKHVWISLKTRADKSVELTIKDDGKGFDPAQLPQMPFQFHGLGLVSMRERVRSLGGTLVVDTAPGQGTCIRVNVPNL